MFIHEEFKEVLIIFLKSLDSLKVTSNHWFSVNRYDWFVCYIKKVKWFRNGNSSWKLLIKSGKITNFLKVLVSIVQNYWLDQFAFIGRKKSSWFKVHLFFLNSTILYLKIKSLFVEIPTITFFQDSYVSIENRIIWLKVKLH